MIARLKGIVADIGDDGAIIDVGGVGYQLFCSGRTLAALPPAGGVAQLHVETIMREDRLQLFGFALQNERAWFRRLMTVQGVGARVALTVLSALSPQALLDAVAARDKAPLQRADGIGPKLAARIVAELRDHADTALAEEAPAAAVEATPVEPADDAISALVNLGFGRVEAHGAVARAARSLGDGASMTALIPVALKELGA